MPFYVQLVAVHQSCGGMVGENNQSYTATIINAAKVVLLNVFGYLDRILVQRKPFSFHKCRNNYVDC